jgi:hypothetical protein
MVPRYRAVLALIAAFSLIFGALAAAAEEPGPAQKPQSAASAPVQPAPAAQAPATTQTAITITIGELKQLLQRGQTPRVAVATRFATTTGKALSANERTLFIDVTGEKVALAGVLGVPLSQVSSLKVLVPLSADEMKAAQEASRKYLAGIRQAAAPTPTPPAPGETAGMPAEVAAAQDQTAKPDLLAVYPPSEGWGPEKLADITRKRVVLGLEPFGKDRSFLKDYDAWRTAYLAKRDEQLQQLAAYEAAGQKAPEGFQVLPELGPVPSLGGAPWDPQPGVESPSFNAVESPSFNAKE